MPGRRLPPESEFAGGRYDRPDFARRRAVLRETLDTFEADGPRLRAVARANLERWQHDAPPATGPELLVLPGDWGDVAGALTRARGAMFAVVNMANANVPGGAYVVGAAAQEENLFRRTDCHFSILDEHISRDRRYTGEMTALLSARDGRVYLDVDHPRTCIRGSEDRSRPDLGYRWLPDDEIFPFIELRAAAQDLRDGSTFDETETRRRIAAQLDTLTEAGVRHAVLSAFGCGAFANPPEPVAAIYRDELRVRRSDFDCVAFAIFHPGYGPDNHPVFHRILVGAVGQGGLST
ncbi:MAG: DUF2263 domain-containing protein [Acidimicrobiia bacterium]|nr:DUF2263 domain-containing protein [Acidimicrobiia bacterium]